MNEIFAVSLDLARPLAAAGALGGAAWWLGRGARRALGTVPEEEPIAAAGVDVALGLALLALLGFWLGIAGWLRLWGVVGGAGVLAAGLWAVGRGKPPSWPPPTRGGGTLRREGGDSRADEVPPSWPPPTRGGGTLRRALGEDPAFGTRQEGEATRRDGGEGHEMLRRTVGGGVLPPCGGGSRRGVLTVAALIVLPLLALALYPPSSFDATMYHLPFAKAFVATGGLPYLVDLRYPVFPQASEVLFAEAMMLGGDRASQLVSLLATLATAAVLFGWGRRASRQGAISGAGELAAALFLGGPIVAYLSGVAYSEPLLVLWVAAAFDRIDRWDGEADVPGRWGLAGVFAGSAAGVKYFGLFPVGVLLALALFARAGSGAGRWRRLAWALGGVVLCAAPWYVRNTLYTGNPLFPVLERLFGPSVWGGPAELAPWSESDGGLSQLVQMLRLPWTLTFGRPAFGRMPPWSPVLGIALAGAFLAARSDRRVRRLLGASLLYLAAFFFLPLDARFLLPILPLLCVAGALALAPLLGRRRVLLPMAILLALAPAALWNLYQLYRLGPVPISNAARERFLGDRLPAYPALRFLERTRGSAASVYAFYAENHVYFAPGRFQGDWGGIAPFAEILKRGSTGDLLADELAARGVTHLLTIVATEPALPRDEGFARRFSPVYDDGKARIWEIR